jgi:RNA polymerase sigma-70 factor (ECF subfamily)
VDASSPQNLEALLSQATWVRQLAAHLVRDPDLAEELVQETWRRALETPPTAEIPEHGLRAWFARVMRNLVSDKQAESDLRSWHERHASRPEAWSHTELHDRVLLQKELADAVLSLEEPYQSVITLRYLEGLTPKEIAKRQDISYAAVRTRISRGLAMLRARLDREHGGDRAAWCAIFMGWIAKGPAPHAAPAPGAGSLILGMDTKVLAGIVVAWAAALMLVWKVNGTGAARVPAWSPDITRLHADRLIPNDGTPRQVPTDRSPVAQAEAPKPRVIDREHDLHGSVIDPSGVPIVGAKVEVFRDTSTMRLEIPRATGNRRPVAVIFTDAQGEFAVALPVGRPFELDISAENRATTKLGYRYAGEHVTVQLGLSAVLQGRVTLAANGESVAGALVQVRTMGSAIRSFLSVSECETDADGRFRFESLPGVEVLLKITPRTTGAPVGRMLVLVPGDTHDENVQIEAGEEIRGRVLDAETGEPIPNAEVGEVEWVERMGRANASGEYVYSGVRPGRALALQARAPGYCQTTFRFRTLGVDDLPDHVDFRLSRGQVLRGRVIDSNGRTLEGVEVAAVANRRMDPPPTGTDWIGGRTDDRGRFELSGLRRDLHHTLFTRTDDFGAVAYALPAPSPEQDVIDLGDVVLPPMSVLHGKVIDESGNAVPDWAVTLRGANEDRWRFSEQDPRDQDVDKFVAERTGRTDDLGRFAFADLAMGEYRVEVGLPYTTARTSRTVSVPRGGIVEDVEVVLRGLESISGTVKDAEGRRLVDVSVSAHSDSAGVGAQSFVLTDSRGHFDLHGLPPGTYLIQVVPMHAHAAEELPGTRTFLLHESNAVSSGEQNLAIVLESGTTIRGRVVHADGAAAEKSRVVVRIPGHDDVPGAITEADGTFKVTVPVRLSFDIEAYPSSLGCMQLPSNPDVPALGGVRQGPLFPSDQELILRLPR